MMNKIYRCNNFVASSCAISIPSSLKALINSSKSILPADDNILKIYKAFHKSFCILNNK